MRTYTLFFCIFVIGSGQLSCVSSQVPTDIDPYLLIPPIERLYLDALTEFQASAAALMTATESWADEGEEAKADTRLAWLDAMAHWQPMDMFRIDPYSVWSYGEENDVESIYTWPVVYPCRIDQVTLNQSYLEVDFFETTMDNTHGLAAIEYLLYGPFTTTCPNPEERDLPDSMAQFYENWQDLAPEEIAVRRAQYARVLATQIHQASFTLEAIWSSHIATILAPENIPAPNEYTEPLTVIVNYLFAVGTRLGDTKLAIPLGIANQCNNQDKDCASYVESNIAQQGGRWLVTNLITSRSIFTGGDGMGFDDLLAAKNEHTLRDNILYHFERAIEIAEALDADLQSEILNNRILVERLHQVVETLVGHLNEVRGIWSLRRFYTGGHED